MRRGVSSGGGQSSLNYLFGSGDAPKTGAANNANNAPANHDAGQAAKDAPLAKPAQPAIPVGANSNRPTTNNYFRADGQNTGNFLTVSQ